jgi:cobalt-zinc-cadmium efflux system protein
MHAHAHHDHHGHAHGAASGSTRDARAQRRAASRRRLTAALALVAAYLVAEAIAGYLTGSLALLADAGHMLADAGSLALALFAIWLVDRPAPAAHTFGYQRAEILAALANGVALVVVAILIAIEAVDRFGAPPAVDGRAVLVVAAGGLAVNLAGLALLHGARDSGLNMRGAWLHVASDALGSVAAIASGAALWLGEFRIADPLASLAISALVLRSAWLLLRETVDVLLEAAPSHVDVDALRRALVAQPGVVSVHDLHVWTITSGLVSLSCHVHGAPDADAHELLGRLTHELRDRFGIYHATIQLEPEGFSEREAVC